MWYLLRNAIICSMKGDGILNKVIMILIFVAIVAFFVMNHFKKQEINKNIFRPFFLFLIILIINFVMVPSLKSDLEGLIFRSFLGMMIGILQGCLAKVTFFDEKIYAVGTVIGMLFWLVFVPVRLVILPWFNIIAPGGVNLEATSYIGISALYIFTGFFFAKAITLYIRKNRIIRNKVWR